MLWLDISAATGTILLAVPVIYLDRHKKLLHDIRAAGQGVSDTEFGRQLRDIAAEQRSGMIAEWRLWHRACLYGGYGLVAVGTIGRMAAAAF